MPVGDVGYQYGFVGRLRLALYGTRDAVCRSTLNLVGSLMADLILVSSIMLRRTSSA